MNQMSNVANVADVMAAPDHYYVIITLPINGIPHYSAILDPDGDTLKPMQAVVGGNIQYVPKKNPYKPTDTTDARWVVACGTSDIEGFHVLQRERPQRV